MKTIPLLLLLNSTAILLTAQTPFPPLKDGIYYTHGALQSNIPNVSFDSILQLADRLEIRVDVQEEHPNRIKQLNLKEGKKRPVKVNIGDIWALCYNGALYISFKQELIRVIKFGAICHFTKEGGDLRPGKLAMDQIANPSVVTWPPFKRRRYRAQQFILDFQTGDILPFAVETVNPIFERDPPLYKQFQDEPDQEIKLFAYIMAYNRRHPVF